MQVIRPKKDIVEIFGYAPNDKSKNCRSLWLLGACPFVKIPCNKKNHDGSVVYGVCSVSSPDGDDCIICPNRLYANQYETLKNISLDAFGNIPFYLYSEFINHRMEKGPFVVALGMHSGHEVNLRSCSMDWVLAKVFKGSLISYTGIEVQSIDITGNYKDTWYAYKNIKKNAVIPKSEHGLNWANVHKRLIPQIIRKSLIYASSTYVDHGLYFVVPEIVYKHFEKVIGIDIPLVDYCGKDVITVHTYALGENVAEGSIRDIIPVRKIRFKMDEFSKRFISGPNLPRSEELDNAVKRNLGLFVE